MGEGATSSLETDPSLQRHSEGNTAWDQGLRLTARLLEC